MGDQGPGWRTRYGFTRGELVAWALVLSVPVLMVVGFVVVIFYEGPVD